MAYKHRCVHARQSQHVCGSASMHAHVRYCVHFSLSPFVIMYFCIFDSSVIKYFRWLFSFCHHVFSFLCVSYVFRYLTPFCAWLLSFLHFVSVLSKIRNTDFAKYFSSCMRTRPRISMSSVTGLRHSAISSIYQCALSFLWHMLRT